MPATPPAPPEKFAPGIEALIDEAIAHYKVPLAPMSNAAASLDTNPTEPSPEDTSVAPDVSGSPSKRPCEEKSEKVSKKPRCFTMLNDKEVRHLRDSSAFMSLKDEFMTCDMESYLAYLAAKSQSNRNQPLDTHMYTEIFRKMAAVVSFMETLDNINSNSDA